MLLFLLLFVCVFIFKYTFVVQLLFLLLVRNQPSRREVVKSRLSIAVKKKNSRDNSHNTRTYLPYKVQSTIVKQITNWYMTIQRNCNRI